MNVAHGSGTGTPVVTEMHVIPVAGQDSMLLNLCGAHAPYFTRNLVILKDSSGHTGIGEVPGGEGIRQALDRSRAPPCLQDPVRLPGLRSGWQLQYLPPESWWEESKQPSKRTEQGSKPF